jgi:predicted outer membrane protein
MMRRSPLPVLCTALFVFGTGACYSSTRAHRNEIQGYSAERTTADMVMAFNVAAIEEGQVAQTRAASAPVRQFGARMVSDHTAAQQQVVDRVRGVSGMSQAEFSAMLQNDPSSRMVVDNHMQAMSILQGLNGMTFDRSYIQRQIDTHQYTLQQLDRFTPMIRRKSDRRRLEDFRSTEAMHLQMAQQIQASMPNWPNNNMNNNTNNNPNNNYNNR